MAQPRGGFDTAMIDIASLSAEEGAVGGGGALGQRYIMYIGKLAKAVEVARLFGRCEGSVGKKKNDHQGDHHLWSTCQ